MSILLNKEINLFFSSSELASAQNVSSDGSRFSVILDNPIKIPQNALNCSLGVVQASIWNTSPNISVLYKNNKFKFTTSNPKNAGTHTIEISDGLYSVSALNSYISTALVNLDLPSNLFTISALSSTGQSVITFSTLGDSVDMTIVDSIRTILGFDSKVITATLSGGSAYSDDVAKFNRNNSYLIQSDLVSGGIPINSVNPNIIASIPISVSPSSQINYTPFNITEVDASNLVGLSKSNINFRLTNQDLQQVSTQGEICTVLIHIRYCLRQL